MWQLLAGLVGLAAWGGIFYGIGTAIQHAVRKNRHHYVLRDDASNVEWEIPAELLAWNNLDADFELKPSTHVWYMWPQSVEHDNNSPAKRADGPAGDVPLNKNPIRFSWLAIDHDHPHPTVALPEWDWITHDPTLGTALMQWAPNKQYPQASDYSLSFTGIHLDDQKNMLWPKDGDTSWFPNGTLLGHDATGTPVHGEWTGNVTAGDYTLMDFLKAKDLLNQTSFRSSALKHPEL